MAKIYLFDWGDTLMVDFPGVPGKMCDWKTVAAVDGAYETLKALSQQSACYVATGAAQSSEADIASAFAWVHLDTFITGYFCKANLGVSKGEPQFLAKILGRLKSSNDEIVMVGDSLEKDVKPALAAGIQAVWLCPGLIDKVPDGVKVITSLTELIE